MMLFILYNPHRFFSMDVSMPRMLYSTQPQPHGYAAEKVQACPSPWHVRETS